MEDKEHFIIKDEQDYQYCLEAIEELESKSIAIQLMESSHNIGSIIRAHNKTIEVLKNSVEVYEQSSNRQTNGYN